MEQEQQEALHQARSDRLQEARNRAKTDVNEGAGKTKQWAHTAKSVSQLASHSGFLSLGKYVDMLGDMPYFFAMMAAVLKDLSDIAFAPTVFLPMIFSILCGIFIAMMLFLAGARKKKGAATQFVKSTIAIIAGSGADAIPGLDLLPIETMVVIVLYIWALMDRKSEAETGEAVNETY